MAALAITKLRPVGRYALGVLFSDGHDSILPYRELRARCPCDTCGGQVELPDPGSGAGPSTGTSDVQKIGEHTIFLRWQDEHETLYVADELRALCRCAHCIGEPNYPITRQ